jgi:hypothetical protein
MGMELFYVTVFFVFFLGAEAGRRFGGFAGSLGKAVFFMWCFCGESMVDCVVVVERRHHVVWRLKICQKFELYFRVHGGKAAKAIPFWEWWAKGFEGLRFLREFECRSRYSRRWI